MAHTVRLCLVPLLFHASTSMTAVELPAAVRSKGSNDMRECGVQNSDEWAARQKNSSLLPCF